MEHFLDLRRPLGLGVVPLRIPLPSSASKIIVGRGSKADIFLYAGEHPSFVSREHAKLEHDVETDRWSVSDLDSVNGMFYNSVKLATEHKALLCPGDRVYFGNPQHSFFVEYEFVTVQQKKTNPPKCPPSPSLLSESSALDYGSDTSCGGASASPPCLLYYNSLLDDGRPSVAFLPSSSSSSCIIHTHEDVPDDLWSCRIFQFLDIREMYNAGWTCRQWMRRAEQCLDVMATIRWKHPWSVDSLVRVLEKKYERNAHPVNTIITEGCYKVRDDHVESLARLCGDHLTHVDFSGTPTVTPRGMRSVARHCKNLKTLVVRGCKRVGGGTWDWMDDLARNGTLEYCDLHCAGSNDSVATKLAMTSPLLRRIDMGVMCTEGISDMGLFELTERCTLLEHVDLRGCKRVTDQGVSLLVQRCGSRLKTLVLHSCDIGNEALKSIGQHCTRLEFLDVHRCIKIDDGGIQGLVLGEANVASTLKHLDLSNLVITDVGLGYLLKSQVKLTSLDLRSCKHVSGQGLSPLVKHMSRTLLKLDLNGCSKLRPIDVIAIAHTCTGVLQELEIGAREDECESWDSRYVAEIRKILKGRTRVHEAFDFPERLLKAGCVARISTSSSGLDGA